MSDTFHHLKKFITLELLSKVDYFNHCSSVKKEESKGNGGVRI
jgi:hypothetical protein